MYESLENMYFNWLCAKVTQTSNSTPSNSYDILLRTLHNTEFVYLIPGDDNRAEDGVELRINFLLEADIPDHQDWRDLPCSTLEMLIALCYRAEWQSDIPLKEWFWHIMENLGLNEFNDATHITPEEIGDILYVMIWRQYEYNGCGGMFPVSNPTGDQRKIEIWYQLGEYLADNERQFT